MFFWSRYHTPPDLVRAHDGLGVFALLETESAGVSVGTRGKDAEIAVVPPLSDDLAAEVITLSRLWTSMPSDDLALRRLLLCC